MSLAGRWLLVAALATCNGTAGASPDVQRGEQIYARCMACHALARDRVGPHHCGLFGRLAGSVPGFDYSAAMKHSGIVWNEQSLDRFLAAPTKVVPGSTMTFDSIPDARERADLIAYLKSANRSPTCAHVTSGR